MAIAVCKFSKFFRGSMSPDPLHSFLFLNVLQINFTEKKIYKLKNDEFDTPDPENNSESAPDVKTFAKGLFTPL